MTLSPEAGGRLLMTVPFVDPGVDQGWDATLLSGIAGLNSTATVDPVNKTVTIDFTCPAAGVYRASLLVFDDQGGTARTFFVTVLLNTPPVAEANGPYVLTEGTARGLSAAGSTDAEQAPGTLAYAWDLDGDGEYDDATGLVPVFDAMRLDGPVSRTVSRVLDVRHAIATPCQPAGGRQAPRESRRQSGRYCFQAVSGDRAAEPRR